MSESFLISLREGFEAALVVSIVLAFVKRGPSPQLAKWVWLGTGTALAIAAAAGVILHFTIEDLAGQARARTFALICASACALLTWMIFWMRTHGRELKKHLEEGAGAAIAESSGFALAMVAFTAVVREGLETALFLLSTTANSGGNDVVAGTLLGLVVATVLGVGLYYGSKRINMRRFFDVTGGLIILFAAGLVAKTVLFLQGSGDLGTLNNAVYNLTGVHWLTQGSQVGRFLAGIFGWDPRPSIEQVVGYLAYLVPISWLYFANKKPKAQVAPAAASAPSPIS